MHVSISAGGGIHNGTWSPVSGEGRWALNLANALAIKYPDIKIDLFNDSKPRWGTQPPIPQISLKSFAELDPNVIYDVAFYVPWEMKLPVQTGSNKWLKCDEITKIWKAKLYIHGSFSWTSGIREFPCIFNCKDHILAHPFLESLPGFQDGATDTPFQLEFIPYPFGWELQSPDHMRKNIVWPSKEIFHPAFETRSQYIPQAGLSSLHAIQELKDIYGKCYFLGAHAFEPSFSPLITKMDIQTELSKINCDLRKWLTYDDIYKVMTDCKYSIPVAGMAASLTESVCLGTMPLVFSGHPLSKVAEELGVLVSGGDPNPKDKIVEIIRMYENDPKLYNSTVVRYQQEMKDHTMDSAATKFMEIVLKRT